MAEKFIESCFKNGILLMLGYQVDMPFEISIKTLNAMEYIESNVQNIEAPRTEYPIIYYV